MTWKTLNAWAGHVTFGLPAALALPALASTITRFGPREALTTAAPLALLVWVPFLAWIHHTRRQPTRRHATHTVVLVMFATVTTVTYLLTPLFFWAVPVVAVLMSEGTRMLVARHRTHPRPHITPASATTVAFPRGRP